MCEREVKASALMLTYNHEQFISRAIEGFLMQKTRFPCELVIAEDCSTDRTREIIREYSKKHPDRIRVLLNRHNIGARRTIVRGYDACRGQYVAFTDGDDYWTCPDKLQRQVDLLDRRPDCAMCFHSVTAVWEDGRQEPTVFRPRKIQDTYTLLDLLEYNFIAACSPMYRRGCFGEYPPWYFVLPVGDWTQHVLHSQYGWIGYIDEPLGVYRQHSCGMYSNSPLTRQLSVTIECLRRFRCALGRTCRSTLTGSLSAHYLELANAYLKEGNVPMARASARKCVGESLRGPRWLGIPLVRMLARVYTPAAYKLVRRMRHREVID